MGIDIWSGALLGRRKNQEDWAGAIALAQQEAIMLVADGMGGHIAGEIASRTAGMSFLDHFVKADGSAIPERLMDSLAAANNAVAERIRMEPRLNGMGTTLLAVYVNDHALYWSSVGDCRLWRFSGSTLTKLNADHSYGAWLDKEAEAGRIDTSTARSASGRNSLMSAIVGESIEMIEISNRPLHLSPNDMLLLASDGIDTLTDEDLRRILSSSVHLKARETGQNILNSVAARNCEHQDNTTIVVVGENVHK
ncbi:PP2C family protein-serine/threonine phosphatase [Sinorhizobium fredii]|uniref:PP2C family protein-serine/threonine phosphatase n=1 Tax=Rhizobium fredii TaxID=380 RepID=UPI00351746DD